MTEEHLVSGRSGEYQRKVWIVEHSTGPTERLCVFLDAEFYLDRMDTVAALSELEQSGILPLSTYLFVSHLNTEARHHDLACNPRYARFIAHDLIAWARLGRPHLPATGNRICGLSLSGLAAAHITLVHPAVFSQALCQSGSFWWDQEWLAANAGAFEPSHSAFWISVGDQENGAGDVHAPTGMKQEVSQVSAAERMVAALQSLRHTVKFQLFNGRHETTPWKDELPEALAWLCSTS